MKKRILGILALAALGGCTNFYGDEPVSVISTRTPVEADQGIRRQLPGNIMGSYNPRKPTDPSEWRRLNKEQTSTIGGG